MRRDGGEGRWRERERERERDSERERSNGSWSRTWVQFRHPNDYTHILYYTLTHFTDSSITTQNLQWAIYQTHIPSRLSPRQPNSCSRRYRLPFKGTLAHISVWKITDHRQLQLAKRLNTEAKQSKVLAHK